MSQVYRCVPRKRVTSTDAAFARVQRDEEAWREVYRRPRSGDRINRIIKDEQD
jgi:hypothetical protein